MKNSFFLLSILLFLFCCGSHQKNSNDMSSLAEQLDTTKKKKTDFIFQDSLIKQTLRVVWVNDSIILANIKIYKAGSTVFPEYETGLIKKHGQKGTENFKDENGKSFPMNQYTIEDKK